MPKFAKGSPEAKEHMAKIRAMRAPTIKRVKRVTKHVAKFVKGSKEAKDHMAMLRAMRK